jgi:hypothetical protein
MADHTDAERDHAIATRNRIRALYEAHGRLVNDRLQTMQQARGRKPLQGEPVSPDVQAGGEAGRRDTGTDPDSQGPEGTEEPSQGEEVNHTN